MEILSEHKTPTEFVESVRKKAEKWSRVYVCGKCNAKLRLGYKDIKAGYIDGFHYHWRCPVCYEPHLFWLSFLLPSAVRFMARERGCE